MPVDKVVDKVFESIGLEGGLLALFAREPRRFRIQVTSQPLVSLTTSLPPPSMSNCSLTASSTPYPSPVSNLDAHAAPQT